MMKKLLSLTLAAAMALSLTACGTADSGNSSGSSGTPVSNTQTAGNTEASGSTESSGKHIYVLTPSEDHGWTGSVATFAKAKVEEINADGKYTAEVITAGTSAEQITRIETILAGKTSEIGGIVIQPMDDTVQSAIQQIIDAGIPYVAFDRIIDGVSASAVSNVKGDNEGIGAGAAAYFVNLGLKPGDSVYVYEGDTSSVTTLRDQGFSKYLTGELAFNGSYIDDADKWSEADLASISYSGAMNWSRANTKTSFESLMGDMSNTSIKWFYAEDDEFAMGILEALNGGGISDEAKAAFLANKPVITGCGGMAELYDVIKGNSYNDIVSQLGGLVSVTYSPTMIQLAIQDMVDHLDGKSVAQDHVISCENVDSSNVDNYQGF